MKPANALVKERRHVCFVSEELHPVTGGGIGTVVAQTAALLRAYGYRVSIVFAPISAVATPPQSVIYVSPEPRVTRELRIAKALGRVHLSAAIDLIETADYHALGRLIVRLPRQLRPRLAVRLHGTSELVRLAEGRAANAKTEGVERHERALLRSAEMWIASSRSVADWYSAHYGVKPAGLCVAPWPVTSAWRRAHPRKRTSEPRVLFYGKLQAVKGAVSFVEAAMLLLRVHPRARFTLAGPDTTTSDGRSMRETLLERIPLHLRDAFHFHGPVERQLLVDLALKHDVAVFPSKMETFCMAAHELNVIGIPMVLRRLPAFESYFTDGLNCSFFDEDTKLADCIAKVVNGAAAAWAWNAPDVWRASDVTRLYACAIERTPHAAA